MIRTEHHNNCKWCDAIMSLEEGKESLCYFCRQHGCQKQATYVRYVIAHGFDKDVEEYMLENWKKTHCINCKNYRECY